MTKVRICPLRDSFGMRYWVALCPETHLRRSADMPDAAFKRLKRVVLVTAATEKQRPPRWALDDAIV